MPQGVWVRPPLPAYKEKRDEFSEFIALSYIINSVVRGPLPRTKRNRYKMSTPLIDIPTGWDPQAKQQQRVALADFSAAPWQGFEKSERGPNNSSLFQPQAAVVVVALWLCLRHKCRRLVRGSLPRTKRKTSTRCVLVFGAREGTRTPKDKPHAPQTCASASSATLAYRIVFAALKSLR